MFNKTLTRIAGGQEINAKKAQAAIYGYVTYLEPAEDEKLSVALRIHLLKRSAPIFKNKRTVEINAAALGDFIVWLGQNATRGKLAPNTIERNFTDLKQFFGWCIERGHIQQLPMFPRLKGDGNRRPPFDYKDWRKLTRHLRGFIKVKDPNVLRGRTMLVNYVLILAATGLRVGGARTLRWRDIREIAPPVGTEQTPDVVLYVTGKTGPREVVSKGGDVKIYFKHILDLRMKEMGTRPSGDDYVFANPDGKPIGGFKTSFVSLLKVSECGDRQPRQSTDYLFATSHLPYLQTSGLHPPTHSCSEYGNEHSDVGKALRTCKQGGECC